MSGASRTLSGRDVAGTIVGALLFAVTALLGRMTVPEGANFALIWPACGFAVLWLLLTRADLLAVNATLLGVTAFVVNWQLGAPWELAALLMVTSVVQALMVTVGLRRFCPDLWGCGGDEAIATPAVLWRVLSVIVLASAVATAIGVVAYHLLIAAHSPWEDWLWLGRNLCGIFLVVTPALLVGQRLRAVREHHVLVDPSGGGPIELVAACLFTLLLYALAFGFEQAPLAFILLMATVWVSLRFSTLVAAVHALVTGVAAVAFTLAGSGPFANASSIVIGSLSVQYYVVSLTVLAMALATGRDERLALAAQVADAERETAERAALYDTVFSSMTEGVNVLDEDGNFLITNEAATELLGFADSEGPGNMSEITAFHPGPGGRVMAPEAKPSALALRGKVVRQMDVVYRTPTGQERTFSVSGSPLAPGADGKRRAVLVFDDVTAERIATAELSEFAWVVAHDLKSPLTAIELWINTAADELDVTGIMTPEFARKFTDGLARSTKRMRQLIEDLLQHAATETVDLVRVPIDLTALVARTVRMRSGEDAVTVADLPTVFADEVLLRLAFDNVIGNALKFVADDRPAQIRVSGVTVGDEVIIRVSDNGIGMPAGQHELMFAEFQRGVAEEYGGTGLGLAIVRRVVTRHDGVVRAYDNPTGVGTVVEFRLPRNPAVA